MRAGWCMRGRMRPDLDLLSPRVREPALELFKSKKAVAIRIERGECLKRRIER